jgi:hypothetical protein
VRASPLRFLRAEAESPAATGAQLLLVVAVSSEMQTMTLANGMRIIGRAFRRAPRPKAKDSRGLRDIERRQQAEKVRAIARLERLRKVTSAVGTAGR